MIPFSDRDGLRDYRASARASLKSCAPWPRWPWLVVVAFLIGLFCGAQLHAAEACVRLQVRPQFLIVRGPIDIQAHVARHPDHRSLFVSWDSDVGAGGSRSFALDGTATDRTVFAWTNPEQPAGHYVIEARVFDGAGVSLGVDRQEILTAAVR